MREDQFDGDDNSPWHSPSEFGSVAADNSADQKHTQIASGSAEQRFWNPIWLHPATLLSFALVSGALAVTTAVLYHLSVVNQGLREENEAYHYWWKYGPTARQ